jgi:hypothetical protein
MKFPPEITLDNRRKYTVDPERYEAIVSMVMSNLVCYYCGGPYTTLHPQVMQNRCLDCYFKEYKDGLKYIGLLRVSQDGDQTHYFIDAKGKIYLSSTSQPDKPAESITETLRYWHFTVPQKGEYQGREIDFSVYHWQIHGEENKDTVLIIEWSNNYFPEYGKHVFICFKDGPTEPFNKRKGEHRKLYQQAKAQMEASRPGPYGPYIVRGREVNGLWESSIYEIVSELASQAYNATHGLVE